MIEALEDPQTLPLRARRPLIGAAALASAVLAPLVDEVVLGGLSSMGRIDLDELLTFGLWGGLLGAALGGLVMRAALRPGRSPAAALGFALLAGIAYPVCLLAVPALRSLSTADVSELLRVLVIGPLAVTFIGMIASVPAGFGFGLLFGAASLHARTFIDRPALDQVARGWASAALLLGIASGAAWFLAAAISGPYCQAIFYVILPALDVVPPEGTDVAWTRLVLFPAPLALAALTAWALSWREHRRIQRLARDLAADTHPTWVLDEMTTQGDGEVLALRESDHGAARRRLARRREDGSPFRDARPAVTYVAAGDRPVPL